MALINFSYNKYEKNLRVQEENLNVEFLTAQARQLYRIDNSQPVVLSITLPGGKELLLVTDSQLQEVFYHNLSKPSGYYIFILFALVKFLSNLSYMLFYYSCLVGDDQQTNDSSELKLRMTVYTDHKVIKKVRFPHEEHQKKPNLKEKLK